MFGLIATVALGCTAPLLSTMLPNMCFKENVKIYAGHFEPEITWIFDIVRDTAPKLEGKTVWITSANDSKHVSTSLHFQNTAIDIRIRNIIGHVAVEARLWAERIQADLGSNYDVVLGLDHIHIEYDPWDG